MPETLLQTKLYVPPLRSNFVPRPHLIERLNQGLEQGCNLTLVSAPAGFGKTTLVSEWMRNLRLDAAKDSQSINRIAWLSMDEGDSDPARFLTYFIAALNQVDGIGASIGEGALVMLQSSQPPPAEGVLTSLINDIAAIPDRIILVLDDYHSIVSSLVDDAFTFLLEHLPSQMHLVIATRDDPQLPLARLRARGQLTEVRATDLRFTSSEAADFLTQVMGLNLSKEHISALETRTEGWIAGLQLAAISMQGSKDATGFIESFTGSHRFVLDYLIEEVLEQQSESVQNFLLQTSILNRVTGSLCDALTGQNTGQETLEMLEHANLFIIPLDEERKWYRYHHLFSDLLRQRLHRTQSDLVLPLHHRASEWYEQNGFADEAIEHYLHADDFDRAAHLIEEQAEAVWGRGEHTKLERWLDGLPAELVVTKPQLCIFHAWILYTNGKLDAAEQSLQAAEQVLEINTNRPTESSTMESSQLPGSRRMKIQGRTTAIRAFLAFFRGDVPGIIQYARQALEYLPERDLTWRSTLAIVLGDAYSLKGELVAAHQAQLEALEACKGAGDFYLVMLVNMKLAVILRSQGKLQQTIEICQQQMQLANEFGLSQTGLVGLPLAVWGQVLAELNDLDGAMRQAKKGVKLTERGGVLAMLGWSYICLMNVLYSSGDLAGAEEIIQKMENVARESDVPPWITIQMAAWQARLWLAQDKLEAASQWVAERGLYPNGESTLLHEIDYAVLIEYVTLARILIAQGQLDEATDLLQHLLKVAESGGRSSRAIEILILQALALHAGGDAARAMTPLERSLTLAEPEGFIRIFVDEGPPMETLLKSMMAEDGRIKEYIRTLLAAFADKESHPSAPNRRLSSPQPLIEPLSNRELEVLHLIAEGLSNREIGLRLHLSPNTIKRHANNIYEKLGVHSRTEAVAKARILDILD